MEFDKCVSERKSVRKFKTKSVSLKNVFSAIDAGNRAPIAGNLPTVRYIVVDDKEKIKELAEACGQGFVASAGVLVAVCSDSENVVRSFDERGERYARQQAGAAIENFLLKLVDLGLSTCWVGAFADAQVKRVLGVPDGVDVEGVFPVGYETEKGKQKFKPDIKTRVYFNSWGNKELAHEARQKV
ncbi:hypothetical protein COV15_00420 [Candidatus Woesearchaeota archaeon CG10_big_fil_rev_8_21_14_0_10_34_12]|nr:MAG: hypothetical protein COV15_00420 [Candidatus Woesearchaeota archaeon CG10_big_fil_rev_8_21_14_0_10_34_12]